jgi:hypothetical protein
LIPTGDNGIPEASKVRLPAMPAVVSAPDVRVEARRGIAGAMDVAVDSPHEATIAAHLFYFPHWQVTDGEGRAVPMGPAGRFRLLTWRVPVGHSLFRVRGGMAPTEREGLFVSAGAAAFLLFLSLFLGFRSRPERVR